MMNAGGKVGLACVGLCVSHMASQRAPSSALSSLCLASWLSCSWHSLAASRTGVPAREGLSLPSPQAALLRVLDGGRVWLSVGNLVP